MKKTLALLLTSLATLTASAQGWNKADSMYIRMEAPSNPKDGLHISYSQDKHAWHAINEGFNYVKSDFGTWGAEKNMHSMSVLKDGSTWYAVWQLNSKTNQFATTCSQDLFLWKPQDYPYIKAADKSKVTVIKPVLTKEGELFVVTFTTTDGRTLRTTSKDFRTWTTAELTGSKPKPVDIYKVSSSFLSELTTKTNASNAIHARDNEGISVDERSMDPVKEITVRLSADVNSKKAISPELFGIFFEDINYAADGGLYAELVQNRDFEYTPLDHDGWNKSTAWRIEGIGTELSFATENPLHRNNSNYAVLKTSQTGGSLVNEGFDGIAVKAGAKYDFSMFVRGKGKVRVSLKDGNKTLAATTIAATASWKKQNAVLKTSATCDKAELHIEPLQQGSLDVDFVSLFPQNTFRGHKNGLRADLAQALADLKPQFVRFPGGCASHGQGIDNIYHWQSTVGELWERESDMNIWHYHQSRGLGFYEYFLFCEDIGAQPLPVLAAGVPCQNSARGGYGQQGGLPWQRELEAEAKAEGKTVEQVAKHFYAGKPLTMESYLQELLDLIEWANGDAKTSALAKMRAKAGHPKPFNLKYLGIGNEDLISDVFLDRYRFLIEGVRKAHPEITLVGTVGPFWEGSDYEFGWKEARQQNIPIVDEHYYNPVGWYLNHQDFYDCYDRSGTKVYLGEWASKGNTMGNALAEALHITNLERNADVVVMSSYAPLLAKEGHTQWNPDLIYFNNTEVKPTVNYHVQRICGQNAGDSYIHSDLSLDFHAEGRTNIIHKDLRKRVSASIVEDKETGDIIVKLVNCLPKPVSTTVCLDNLPNDIKQEAKVEVVSGADTRTRMGDVSTSTVCVSAEITYEMPKYSLSVIRIQKNRKK